MSDQDRLHSEGELRETARRADELAEEARDDAALMRDAQVSPESRPVYPPGLGVVDSPAVERADRVRRRDDQQTFDRQGQLAEAQGRAAEDLSQNAERLEQTRAEMNRMEARVHDNADAVSDIQDTIGRLRENVDRAGEAVRDIPVDTEGDRGGDR